MKYRSDFVTNSSSSSFIVAFKNKADMQQQYQYMNRVYPQYVAEVFEDIQNSRMTYTETVEYLKERLALEARYEIRFRMPEYEDKKFDYAWFRSDEYKKIEKKYVDEQLEWFKSYVNHRGIFAKVTYSDHDNSELEHRIMPKMPFVAKIFSNH